MKKLITLVIVLSLFVGCESTDDSSNSNLTGKQMTYALLQGSEYNISGSVIIQETVSKSALISVELTGTEEGLSHPTHLHYGDIAGGGEMAAMLTPIDGGTGKSVTELSELLNLESITYDQLINMEANIKVHLSNSGEEKKIILAAGNVGAAFAKEDPNGRIEITVCKSN